MQHVVDWLLLLIHSYFSVVLLIGLLWCTLEMPGRSVCKACFSARPTSRVPAHSCLPSFDVFRIWSVRIIKNAKPPSPNVTKGERRALRDLKKDKSIILSADKGRSIQKLVKKLQDLKNQDKIDLPHYHSPYPTTETTPWLYELANNEETPLRPIVSSFGSIT